jgi:hypothetical protein
MRTDRIEINPRAMTGKPEIREDRLEDDPRFLRRIEAARQSFRVGRSVPFEDAPE